MSSFESLYKKMISSLEHPGAATKMADGAVDYDPARHIAPLVAHELNNILTIIQGHSDRLRLKYLADTELQPQLKLISEATKRAANVVRDATPANPTFSSRQFPRSPSPMA